MQACAQDPGLLAAGSACAVIGLGATGRSCLRFLARRGLPAVAFDTRPEPPGQAAVRAAHPDLEIVTGALDSAALAPFATLVVSPGIALDEPALRAARERGQALIGDVELFARARRAPVIAITGTNGKSTVTTLVGEMLAASGRAVRVGGNLGVPVLDLLEETEPDCYVLELSSFQLELTRSLAPAVAAVLNITPDHLDRHGSFAAYAAAKARIFAHAAMAVVNADDAVVAGLPTSGRRLEFTLGPPGPDRYGLAQVDGATWLMAPDGALVAAADLAIAGRHNLANALAALAVCDAMGAERAPALAALTRFGGLAHRAERVGSHAGVTFIDDSKATNPGAAIATIEGLLADTPGVVIAGGEPKGTSFAPFADCLARHARSVVLIGRAAPAIAAALAGRVPTVMASDMHAAVAAAAQAAHVGDVVLLAPACASFDMFRDYADRGAAFRAAAHALGAR